MFALAKWWGSIAFRQALIYGALVLLTMGVLVGVFYQETVGVWQHQIDHQIDTSTDHLVSYFTQNGSAALATRINELLGDGIDSDTEIYLLVDPNGHKLVGNLEPLANNPMAASAIVERRVVRAGRPSQSRIRVTRLTNGGTLVVGRDMRDQYELQRSIRRACLFGAAIAILMAVAGALVFRHQLERRIGAIRQTALQIERGDLGQRVPVSQQEDEFARLSRDINAMLDRIHALMEGVRHVSNTIAHNIRTPLSRILARLHQAQKLDSRAELSSATGFAIREIEDLNVVFDKLLQIAEVESGARRQNFGPVSLNAIAVNVIELYDPVAEAKGLALTHAFEGDAVTAGDGDLLANAMANLLDNAIKYTHSGGAIHVDTRLAESVVAITVRDNGRGIPDEERARVGTRFHRVDRSVPGWGLGLASVMAIARLHGGTLQLDDARPGLIARLTLPALAS
ncbi:MAG TPA: HAMP domain-containing sensor histidine kinase [Steroidobacteraceae bacterium]|jgi:signal transduction histidine kinase|nr:HAMP domain-containing sensor histidine kinase [Steroidobacteraceae bacterium]